MSGEDALPAEMRALVCVATATDPMPFGQIMSNIGVRHVDKKRRVREFFEVLEQRGWIEAHRIPFAKGQTRKAFSLSAQAQATGIGPLDQWFSHHQYVFLRGIPSAPSLADSPDLGRNTLQTS